MSKIQEYKKRRAELEASMQEIGKEALAEAFKPFFDENPDVGAIGWQQYTPYFNDGDPCEFAVHDLCALVGEATAEAVDDFDGYGGERGPWFDAYCAGRKRKSLVTALNALRTAAVDDALFESVFGDHVTVVAKRDGTFVVNECEHD